MTRRPDPAPDAMPDCCFLSDPRDAVSRHTDAAVFAYSDALRAIHLRAAEHQADIAKANGIVWRPRRPNDMR